MKLLVLGSNQTPLGYIDADEVVLERELNKLDILTFICNQNTFIRIGNYIKVNNEVYLIRSVDRRKDGLMVEIDVYCESWVSELINDISKEVSIVEETVSGAMNLALQGNRYGWQVGETDLPHLETMPPFSYTNKLKMILDIASHYGGQLEINHVEKKINVWRQRGSNNGVIVSFDRNSNSLELREDVSSFGTRLYPLGADNITISSVNGGVEYLSSDNEQVYGVVDVVWKTDIYSPADLKLAAEKKLKLIENPQISFSVKIQDLSRFGNLDVYKLDVGDVVRLYDEELNVNIRSEVVRIKEVLDRPEDTEITIDNLPRAYRDWEKELLDLLTLVEGRKDVWDKADSIDTSIHIEFGSKDFLSEQTFVFKQTYLDRPISWVSLDTGDLGDASVGEQVSFITTPLTELNNNNVKVYKGIKVKAVGATSSVPVGYKINMSAYCASPDK